MIRPNIPLIIVTLHNKIITKGQTIGDLEGIGIKDEKGKKKINKFDNRQVL